MQAWGNNQSKFVARRTFDAPSKSGVIGLLCAAMGIPRAALYGAQLARFTSLRMAVRIDRPGIRWWDYHTVGAGLDMRIAEGEDKVKPGAMLTRREFLCDASFLVALQGDSDLLSDIHRALRQPVWTPFLGRKSCPPSRPLVEAEPAYFSELQSALASMPWQPRLKGDERPAWLESIREWSPSASESEAPPDAEIWYDVPVSFEPPAHAPRFVVRTRLSLADGTVSVSATAAQRSTPLPRALARTTETPRTGPPARPDLTTTADSVFSANPRQRQYSTSHIGAPEATRHAMICARSAACATTP